MPLLKVFLKGQLQQELNLNENNSYTGGRDKGCNISLNANNTISRQHFKLEFQDNQWQLENISKYGEILVNEQSVSSLVLRGNLSFTIPPYSFSFVDESQLPEESPSQEYLPAIIDSPEKNLTTTFNKTESKNNFDGDNERTFIGSLDLIPHLRFVDSQKVTQKIIRLEGNTWVAGRDERCPIHIDDKKVSRRQFEIRCSEGQYFIRDLGSVNGTLVNNQRISSEQPTPISSGATISILEHQIYFEIKDETYSEKIQTIQPSLLIQPYTLQPQQMSHHSSIHIPQNQLLGNSNEERHSSPLPPITISDLHPKKWKELKQRLQRLDFKKHKFRITLMSLIAVISIGLLFNSGNNGQQKRLAKKKDPFSQLSVEKQGLVKHSYQLAKNLYMQAKYELAAAEINKIHSLVPSFEDSKEIEEYCSQAFELRKQQDLIERQRQQEEELKQKVLTIIATCKNQLRRITVASEMTTCLNPALELDPQNNEIQALILQANSKEEEHKRKIAEQNNYRKQIKRGKRIFNKATIFHKQGKFLSARKVYKNLLRSGLPDPNGLKALARRKIASIEKSLSSQVRKILDESEQAYKDGQLKQALGILEKSVEVDPKNKAILQKTKFIKKELEKNMQVIFQESILEEALGKVDVALAGWKKIMEQDYETGKYYKKAQIKLKKYGQGL